MNEAGPEFPNIGLDLPDILPETVQLGDHDLVSAGLPVLPARDYRPGNDDDQDTDGSDYFGQPS